MFHGLLKNGVSFPLLYCRLKEKTQAIYERLLGLVESIAQEREMSIFKRSVRLMVDFEKSFHNAVLPLEAGRTLLCCLFHFVSSMKKKMLPDVRHKKKCSEKVFDIKLISGWNCKIQSPQENKETLNHEKDHFYFGCGSNAAFTRGLRQHGAEIRNKRRRQALCLPSAFKCAILGVRRNETRRIAMKGEEQR